MTVLLIVSGCGGSFDTTAPTATLAESTNATAITNATTSVTTSAVPTTTVASITTAVPAMTTVALTTTTTPVSAAVPSTAAVPPTTTVEPATTTVPISTTVVDPASTTVLTEPPPSPIQLEPGERLRVVLTGDSITDQISPYLKWILGRFADVERRHFAGTALCDWFADRGDDLGFENLEEWRPHVYVVDHGGNALTPCMADADGKPLRGEAYEEKYLADSERLVDLAARTDSRVLFVDQPVSRGDLVSGTHPVFQTMPERHPGGNVRFLSTWASVSPGGRFLQSAPCEAVEPGCIDGMGELRSPPPGVHLEALGAWRYAKAIVEEFVAAGWVDATIVDLSDRAMP